MRRAFVGARQRRRPTKSALARRALSASKEVRLAIFSHQAYMNASQVAPIKLAYPNTRVVPVRLSTETAALAAECNAVCLFVNDDLSAETIWRLTEMGVECAVLRCAGFDRVDLAAAEAAGLLVLRVPAYSPHAVAEHSVALALALNRQIVKAAERVRVGNYALSGLVGFDMHGKTVGIVGTGKIGRCAAAIYHGMGCRVLAYDVRQSPEALAAGYVEYVSLEELLREAQLVSLHCPLNDATYHLINADTLATMRAGAVLINVSRGGLVDTKALLEALDNRTLSAVGLDVYEQEAASFFKDLSVETDATPGASLPDGWDSTLASLATRPNVIVTPHAAFLTAEALQGIADTTILNLAEFANGGPYTNQVCAQRPDLTKAAP